MYQYKLQNNSLTNNWFFKHHRKFELGTFQQPVFFNTCRRSKRITNMTITIQVLFFASAREAAGNISSVELELPEGSDTTSLRQVKCEETFYPKYRFCVGVSLLRFKCCHLVVWGGGGSKVLDASEYPHHPYGTYTFLHPPSPRYTDTLTPMLGSYLYNNKICIGRTVSQVEDHGIG